MAPSSARIGRRRRVLNEEARNSSSRTVAFQSPVSDGDTPRYGCQANIENHPQVTDLVPRHYRTIVLVVAMGISLAVAAEALVFFSPELSGILQVVSEQQITSQLSAGMVAWTSSAVLLLAACFAKLVYSLRRHRVDDYKGSYRVWRSAAWACVALSINAVIGAHSMVAPLLAHATGWNWFDAGTLWWLVPAVVVGGWLGVKLALDVSECRTALTAQLVGGCCFAVAAAAVLGWAPAGLAAMPQVLTTSVPLLGFVFLLASHMLYARYVVLDVQGLIPHAEIASTNAATPEVAQPESSPQAVAEEPTRWLDGSEGAEDPHEEKPRLSKADRKRLRKQKQRNRAA